MCHLLFNKITFSENPICIDLVKHRAIKVTKLQPSWLTNTDKEQTNKKPKESVVFNRRNRIITKQKSVLQKYQQSRNYRQSINYTQGTFIVMNIHATCIPYARVPCGLWHCNQQGESWENLKQKLNLHREKRRVVEERKIYFW